MRRRGSLAAAAVALLLAQGCAAKFEAPPIECGYRPSFVGAGNILRLENRAQEPLREVVVEIRSATGEVSYEQAELGAFEVLEVGWKKLGGFEIPNDAKIEIRAKGFLLPLRVDLEASSANPEDGAS